MKKILVVVSFMLAAFSFQANAATLTWNSPIPSGASTSGSGTETLIGSVGGLDAGILVDHTWSFNLSETSLVNIAITSVPTWLQSLTFSGGAMIEFSGFDPLAHLWQFTGVLAAGDYSFHLEGITQASSGYQIRVAETPIPAAVWLFGSAFMGLTGLTRRKIAKT